MATCPEFHIGCRLGRELFTLPTYAAKLYFLYVCNMGHEQRYMCYMLQSLYEVNYMYLQPVVILSILFGVWGMSMTIKMLSEVLKDHQLQAKFLVLQFVLLLAKFQGLIARIVVWCGLIRCEPPITPAVYANRKLLKL